MAAWPRSGPATVGAPPLPAIYLDVGTIRLCAAWGSPSRFTHFNAEVCFPSPLSKSNQAIIRGFAQPVKLSGRKLQVDSDCFVLILKEFLPQRCITEAPKWRTAAGARHVCWRFASDLANGNPRHTRSRKPQTLTHFECLRRTSCGYCGSLHVGLF